MNPEEYTLMFNMEKQHWYFRGKQLIVRELLRPHLNTGPLTILDAGCGTGGMLAVLRKMGTIFAIDPCYEATAYCASRGFSNIAQASIMALPFADSSFDLVTCFDVIEHVDDDRGALQELRRVLRPGGILLITVPAFSFLWSGHDEALHHKRRYSDAELRKKVTDSRFRIVRFTSFNTVLFPLIAAFRVARRILGVGRSSSDSSELPAPIINSIFYRILKTEATFLKFLNFPVGVSLACLAKKEEMN